MPSRMQSNELRRSLACVVALVSVVEGFLRDEGGGVSWLADLPDDVSDAWSGVVDALGKLQEAHERHC